MAPLAPLEISKTPSPNTPGHVRLFSMETITRQVGELLPNERSAAELLLGHRLRGNERIVLQVLDLDVVKPPEEDTQPGETLPAWCNVYEDMTDLEIEKMHQSIVRCYQPRSVE